jgi:hypothetical protein
MEFNTARLEASARIQEYASGNRENGRRRSAARRAKGVPTVGADEDESVQSEESDGHHLDDVV